MTLSIVNVALALNFWYFTPTFNPLGIRKEIIGSIFLAIGVAKIVVLTVYRRLRLLRLMQAVNFVWLLSWGVATTQSVWQGRSSLQLFIVFGGLAAVQMFSLIEPWINPATRRKPK